MKFNLLHKTAIALCLGFVIAAQGIPANLNFEKIVKKASKQLHDCEAEDLKNLGEHFAKCSAVIQKLFENFADPKNSEHARIHAAKMHKVVEHFRTAILNPFGEKLTSGTLAPDTQAALTELYELLNTMCKDMAIIADVFANYKGTTTLWELQAFANSLSKWQYLLPKKLRDLPTLTWKAALEKRYAPEAAQA
jgi:hypothetical protein